jgi:hypothetical protein
MRHIGQNDGLGISFSHAALENDGDKYMEGVNIIECIKERLLPDFTVAAITQELTASELDDLGGLATSGIVAPYTSNPAFDLIVFSQAMAFLNSDDASLGVISFELGKRKPTYTT